MNEKRLNEKATRVRNSRNGMTAWESASTFSRRLVERIRKDGKTLDGKRDDSERESQSMQRSMRRHHVS